MSAATKTAKAAKAALDSVVLLALRDAFIAAASGAALASAFPKIGAAWIVPCAAAALFWTWHGASWKRAFVLGWIGGVVFFSINFSWWTYTIGGVVGPFWAAMAVGVCAVVQALAWAATGALTIFARARAAAWLVPVATAAAFAVAECVRSIGVVGIPFAQLGYTQADTPLRVFAAYGGTYGLTFALCLIGAYLADAAARRTLRPLLACACAVAAAWAVCWLAWPARRADAATIPVAAVQGDIVQSLKWQPGSLQLAVTRYVRMTNAMTGRGLKLIVWPETVITERGIGLNGDPVVESQFSGLAQRMKATLVAGSIATHNGDYYNALFFFTPGQPVEEYDKRQLVPYAENFPAAQYLHWLPFIGSLNGGFANGTVDGVYATAAGFRVAPLICWESAFADLIHAQIVRGAQLLVISTDDAWFGETSGPYQHAQIAQLDAIENGVWIVRAAATGISGIIAPDGTWKAQAGLDRQETIVGAVGVPPGSPFERIGPTPVVATLSLLYVAIALGPLAFGRRRA